MKNIILTILIIFVIYILLIFIGSDIANTIAKTLHIEGFNERILNIKGNLDDISTKIPTKENLQDMYSGAKDNAIKGLDITKDKIDNIRIKADEITDTYNKAEQFIGETQTKINTIQENLQDLEKVGNTIINSVNTGTIQ